MTQKGTRPSTQKSGGQSSRLSELKGDASEFRTSTSFQKGRYRQKNQSDGRIRTGRDAVRSLQALWRQRWSSERAGLWAAIAGLGSWSGCSSG